MTLDVKALSIGLEAWSSGQLDGHALAAQWSSAADAAGLAPKFGSVLRQILMPLQSAAMFDGESCSFSQEGLSNQLRQWLAAAERAQG